LIRVKIYVLNDTEGGAHADILNHHFVFLLIQSRLEKLWG
jgi:hypothetical protein